MRKNIFRAMIPFLLGMVLLAGYAAEKAQAHVLDLPGCKKLPRWHSDQEYQIDTKFFDSAAKRNAIIEVGKRINTIGGQWFDIHFVAAERENRVTMGFIDGADGVLMRTYIVNDGCEIVWTEIVADVSEYWAFGVPADYDENYWEAGETVDILGYRHYYFRPSMLHELLHTAGLDDEPDLYSIMDYGVFPWTNRTAAKQVEPLPHEREVLRILYPATSSVHERDYGISNTYVHLRGEDNLTDVAETAQLCSPAEGDGFSEPFHGFCANNGTPDVCPGDKIKACYTLINYGTNSAMLYQSAWFSTNPKWSTSDKKSPTQWRTMVDPGESRMVCKEFRVPSTVKFDTEYYMIIKIATSSSQVEESTQNNWIPLRGGYVVPPGPMATMAAEKRKGIYIQPAFFCPPR